MTVLKSNRPRFTQSVEVHAGVGDHFQSNLGNSPDFIRLKHGCDRKRKLQRSPYWNYLKNVSKNHSEIQNNFRILKHLVQEALGNDATSEAIDEAVVYLLDLYKEKNSFLGQELSKLKTTFCLLTNSLLERINEAIGILMNCIAQIEVKPDSQFYEPGFKKIPKCIYLNNTPNINTSMLFNGYDIQVNKKFKKVKAGSPEKVGKQNLKPKFDISWLKNELIKTDNGSIGLPEDIAESIVVLLCTKKTNDELQTDLFDLLGFERFELIQNILKHRKSIELHNQKIQDYQEFSESLKKDVKTVPQISVTVESENERLIMKQIRKDEKKIARLNSKAEKDKTNEAYQCAYLKQQREEALIAERQTPIFKDKHITRSLNPSISTVPDFPFVFDSFAAAKAAAGFIAGTKLHLPVGFERIKEKTFEEIKIPAETNKSNDIPNKLIPIETLDEVGRIVFKGCKNLNVIQSIVFNTAYYSNENILVCAPTGAGKTNVALLTVIHQIKLHMKNGVIAKDDFKIVYVAPMKALAAEMTQTFGKKLAPLGLQVKELTGDMKLTKFEIMSTQMIVTTPEKWDVTTRKPGDDGLSNKIRLLIIDEVHLLHGERGAVIEALVARTLRQVESTQSMIRIVGLSATLPNYVDVANFLRVNCYSGLFFFDGRFRPVPLEQAFVGVTGTGNMQQMQQMDQICMDKVTHYVRHGHQVMVFVHARTATVRTAMTLRELAQNQGTLETFRCESSAEFSRAEKSLQRSRNKQLKELFTDGFGIHHAGMLRSDRSMVEKLFTEGFIKVLVCTATLAWGVNLPAHAVIIKGTEIYDAKHGSFVDLGILDVIQIFGRAGRPQFDKLGSGCIITTHSKLAHYLSLLTCQYPIESSFVQRMTDNLNAEISLGTVSTVEEAKEWLSYTYLFVRMRKNPQAYGIKLTELQGDPMLDRYREELVYNASMALDKSQMIRFDEKTGYLNATDLGRTASNYYIKYETIEIFNELLSDALNEAKIFAVVSKAQEFEQLKVRDDELDELDNLRHSSCSMFAEGGSENTHGKVNILLQSHISRAHIDSFSLVSDQGFVAQNASRIMRALFEITLKKGWAIMAGRLLKLSLVLDKTLWHFENPLKQFNCLSHEVMDKIERKKLSVETLREMPPDEIGHMINHLKMGKEVKKCAESLPKLDAEATVQPITSSVLRVKLTLKPDFIWNDKFHGKTNEAFWIWVEDPLTNHIYHHEYFLISKKQVIKEEEQVLVFTIPIFEPLPSQYCVRICSDRWLGSDDVIPLSFKHLILPGKYPPHTELLDLQPLPVTALQNPLLEKLYSFTHFNPIQTQLFHCLYHTDNNVLLGAPTGSGKTITAEIAMFKVFRDYPGKKVVYIAPLKALVREQLNNWRTRLEKNIGLKVVELTGDFTPDVSSINQADIIVTTPEKWDGVSRNWQTRNYVRDVALIVIDEIHLLGEDRGPVLEVIVSRTNFIAANTATNLRVIGLSTALANAQDLANWLGIDEMGMYNFRPSVRPVPLEVHISGFPGKHYCPRMATMNKPAFQAINTYSCNKPVLIFVSSRRQTRLTSMDLIAYLAGGANPKQWLHLDEAYMENILSGIRDSDLKLSLSFGIGLHHAGLHEHDRRTVEELFVNQNIQVLIATSTLAWGVNFPAHLVIIKGTEYYDGKTKRYVDFPVTDVLQMMGRAGRPQFDDNGIAVIYVQDSKKQFYKKFLYEPFPVESSLLSVLPDHINAEIVAETIKTKDDALEYLTWTYFFRRLLQNPSYYSLVDTDVESVNKHLSTIAQEAINTLVEASCIEVLDDNRSLRSTNLGVIASYYYISHETAQHFRDQLTQDIDLEDLLGVLCEVKEYAELPVRHNEDNMNSHLATICPLPVDSNAYDSPHVKANLLLQSHFFNLPMPCADYYTDLKSVLDQAVRLLQAMIDVSAAQGWLATTLRAITLLQMCIQACWYKKSAVSTLPHVNNIVMDYLSDAMARPSTQGCLHLPVVMAICQNGHFEKLAVVLRQELQENHIQDIFSTLKKLPILKISLALREDNTQDDEPNVSELSLSGNRLEETWTPVTRNTSYILVVTMNRLNRTGKQERRCMAPKFPKQKDEGWMLIMGNPENRELIALKRVPFIWGNSIQMLQFTTPNSQGRLVYNLYALSDSYLGLDQQYRINLEIA